MNVSELYNLVTWIDRELGAKRIAKQFGALHSILNQNTQAGQAKQPFEQQQASLTQFLRNIDVSNLSLEQLAFLEKLKIAPHLGAKGAEEIENILYRKQLDLATAATGINEIAQSVTQGVDKAKQIQSALIGLVPEGAISQNSALVRVAFRRDASMNNVTDFQKWGDEWHVIGRGLALLHEKAPEDVRIVGATSGSVIIELETIYAIAGSIGTALAGAYVVADRVLSLLKKLEEFRGEKLKNQKALLELLEKEAEHQKAEGIKEVVQKVLVDAGKPNADGEVKEAVKRAVTRLIGFVQKGGEIDCVVPPDPETKPDGTNQAQIAQLQKLRNDYKEIRVLEAKVRLIEFKPPPNGG